jgi:transposase-like protein
MRKKSAIFRLRKGFDTEAKCQRRLERLRWPEGLACPSCCGRRIAKFEARGKTGKKRRLYTCLACRYQYTVTAGTLFHDSHLPLKKWFTAIFALSSARKHLSARRLQRELKLGSYETAWSLVRRIRRARERGDALLRKIAALATRR